MEMTELTAALVKRFVESIPEEDLNGVSRKKLFEVIISRPDTVREMLSLANEI